MARSGRQERNRTVRSFRQLRRFHQVINSDKVFGTHRVLLKASADPNLRNALGIDASSQIVLFGLEGATDPEIYERLVGAKPDDVFDRQSKLKGLA